MARGVAAIGSSYIAVGLHTGEVEHYYSHFHFHIFTLTFIVVLHTGEVKCSFHFHLLEAWKVLTVHGEVEC